MYGNYHMGLFNGLNGQDDLFLANSTARIWTERGQGHTVKLGEKLSGALLCQKVKAHAANSFNAKEQRMHSSRQKTGPLKN